VKKRNYSKNADFYRVLGGKIHGPLSSLDV